MRPFVASEEFDPSHTIANPKFKMIPEWLALACSGLVSMIREVHVIFLRWTKSAILITQQDQREREIFVSFTPEESELKSQGLLLPSSFLETNRPRPFSSGATCAELSFNTCKAEDNLDAAHTHLAEARAQNAAMLEAKFKKPYPFILWNKFGSRS